MRKNILINLVLCLKTQAIINTKKNIIRCFSKHENEKDVINLVVCTKSNSSIFNVLQQFFSNYTFFLFKMKQNHVSFLFGKPSKQPQEAEH